MERKNYYFQHNNVLAQCLIHGCSHHLGKNHEGTDLMIPIVLEDNRLSFILIQVKFWQVGSISIAKLKVIRSEMRTDKCFQFGAILKIFLMH